MSDSHTGLLLTKILPLLVYPLGASIGLLLLAGGLGLAGRSRGALAAGTAAVLLLWAASTRPVAAWALGTLERQYPPRALAETPTADVAILLGGGVDVPVPPRREAELNDAGDRVVQAARLFRAGKVGRILVTGGNIPWLSSGAPEAQFMRAYLIELGVPEAAIEIAGQSRTTRENASEIAAMWTSGRYRSALLVTSAAHMPRSLATFRQAGIPVTDSSTDVRGVPSAVLTVLDWLPDAEALERTTQATKEWLGLLAYRIRGDL